ncbi:MAG: 50S ribosomal protein L9 [Candidatus Yonathbacteria bacterium]|nr:50S ribosomal protein L9 [Candidatus Yonathbacteria bacterium]
MKIIFLKDVPRIGKKYEVKEVADGYGRHLVLSRVAEIATPQAVASVEKKKIIDATQKKVHEELLIKTLESLDDTVITIFGKANEKGHLFASIHKDDILKELKRSTHIDMHPDYLILDKPLKELGSFKIPVVINKHRAVFTVVVERGK